MTSEEKITGMKWASGYEEAVTRNILMWTKPILINVYVMCISGDAKKKH